jgi:hypothetical protein
MSAKNDWNEVVQLNPQGYCEIQDDRAGLVYHGPVEKISIDPEDNVIIELKWVAQMGLRQTEGFGIWKKCEKGHNTIPFPNFMVEFVIEPTPEKGHRIRFGMGNIIYLEPDPESDQRILAAIS